MTIRAGQVPTPDGYVPAVVNVDPTTGNPVVSDALTNAQLRASPVPVSGPLTDAQLRATAVPVSGPLTDAQLRATAVQVAATSQASPVYTAPGAFPTGTAKQFGHLLWTDGTTDGSGGGAFALAGAYSAVSPRIVYRTFAAGAMIRRIGFVMTGSGTLTLTGWGTGAALTNGLRIEIVSGDPTVAATAAQFRYFPSTGTTTLVRGLGELMLLGQQADINRENTAAFLTVEPVAPGGLYVPAGSSFRIIVQDGTSTGATAFTARIVGHELG